MIFARIIRLLTLLPYQARNVLESLLKTAFFVLGGYRKIASKAPVDRARRVTMVSYVPVAFDPRIRRAAVSLAEAGYDVVVVKPGDNEKVMSDDQIRWHKRVSFVSVGLSGTSEYFPYAYDYKMYQAVIETKPGIIHCHDVNTCLMGLLAASNCGAVMVGDFHEWGSENVSLNH